MTSGRAYPTRWTSLSEKAASLRSAFSQPGPKRDMAISKSTLSKPVQSPAEHESFRAKAFREKPSEETAEGFLEAGNFVWNSGMFFYTINSFLRAVEATQPLAYGITLAISNAFKEGNDEEAKRLFEMLPNVSIDYAVMERSEEVFVLRANFPWDDVGAWDAMARSREQDSKGNVTEGRVLLAESTTASHSA